jgi:hypothetical protein
MATTYQPIATYTASSAQTTITFSSFSGYTDVIFVLNVKCRLDDFYWVRYNSDSGTNYSWISMSGSGSAAAGGRTTNSNSFQLGAASTGFNGQYTLHINNYSNATTYKPSIFRGGQVSGSGTAAVNLGVANWRSTAAITSVTFGSVYNATCYDTGTTITAYGIKAA